MIEGRSFVVTDNTEEQSLRFYLKNGLQQGTINSPILFNIYTSDLLKCFNLNSEPNKKALAFADDLIIYVSVKNRPSFKINYKIYLKKFILFMKRVN